MFYSSLRQGSINIFKWGRRFIKWIKHAFLKDCTKIYVLKTLAHTYSHVLGIKTVVPEMLVLMSILCYISANSVRSHTQRQCTNHFKCQKLALVTTTSIVAGGTHSGVSKCISLFPPGLLQHSVFLIIVHNLQNDIKGRTLHTKGNRFWQQINVIVVHKARLAPWSGTQELWWV